MRSWSFSIGEFTSTKFNHSRRFTFYRTGSLHTCKFTQKSDVYSFGIIMYLIATGEPPFRDRKFNRDLICDIIGRLRPSMHQWCCDADPYKRFENGRALWDYIIEHIDDIKADLQQAFEKVFAKDLVV